MGCDIHIHYEKKTNGQWEEAKDVRALRTTTGKWGYTEYPLDYRNYNMFAFLAGVRNYCNIKSISEPRGFPQDCCHSTRMEYQRYKGDYHSESWLYISELTSYVFPDFYEGRTGMMEDAEEFLGNDFFKSIDILEKAGVERIVFWFDN